MEINMQLHGGGGGGSKSSSTVVKTSAPGSVQAASIDGATQGERERIKEKFAKARGRSFTNKTNGELQAATTMNKQLLGE